MKPGRDETKRAAERVHAALDGELPREALDAGERAQLSALERAAEGARAELPADVPPALSAQVMARVRAAALESAAAAAAPRRGIFLAALDRALEWLWSPRSVSFTLRPAFALSGALVVLLALAGVRGLVERAGVAELGEARVFVHFRLDAPGATRVQLAGDFTAWKPAVTLHEATPGVWSVAVPLRPGVHDYAFVVDGRTWRADPLAPAVDDGFGGSNSRVAVMPPVGAKES